ncbi:unnamed protein product [Owenia fusiformis]|uniref:Uncharacterized protein n=1 Tax=Owenia fusiformis TaxID=6347 RepID=A0A8J1TZC0_OWEFU|nr:unnamed protein product [Owenia fusiformis]
MAMRGVRVVSDPGGAVHSRKSTPLSLKPDASNMQHQPKPEIGEPTDPDPVRIDVSKLGTIRMDVGNSQFYTKGGIIPISDSSDSLSLEARHGSASVRMKKMTSRPHDGTRFPKLDNCAHFHYDFVELGPLQIQLSEENQENFHRGQGSLNNEQDILFSIMVSHGGKRWTISRSYEDFRSLDKQLHRCIYDRKYSKLPELKKWDSLFSDGMEPFQQRLALYLGRLSNIAGSMINCGPVLNWFEMDNRGNRLIVTDESAINTPAVACAHVIKRYSEQAPDEINLEVGDMISVIDMPPAEDTVWWRGKKGFVVGYFPCEHVEIIGERLPQSVVSKIPATPPKEVLRRRGKLISFLRNFFNTRPQRNALKRSGIVKERVFGCDLGEHLLNTGNEIPLVLKVCTEVIETHGVVDGIYRLSGVASNIQKLRVLCDSDTENMPDLTEECYLNDIHSISSLVKMYFRELPNPLLTYQLYDKFAAAVQAGDNKLMKVHDVIHQLPPPHYRTCAFLMKHLSKMASFSSKTAMHSKNIAIVWAPNLMRSKELETRGNAAALQGVGVQAVVTEYLVRYADLLFNDKELPNFTGEKTRGDSKRMRPKSLAISTPTKLLSLEQARERALSTSNAGDQKYIEVGGGPSNLPSKYHTVIDLPGKKRGKDRKSPGSTLKSFFSSGKGKQGSVKGRYRKSSEGPGDHMQLPLEEQLALTEEDIARRRRLRSVRSADSLLSGGSSQRTSVNNDDNLSNKTNSFISERHSFRSRPVSMETASNGLKRSSSEESFPQLDFGSAFSLSDDAFKMLRSPSKNLKGSPSKRSSHMYDSDVTDFNILHEREALEQKTQILSEMQEEYPSHFLRPSSSASQSDSSRASLLSTFQPHLSCGSEHTDDSAPELPPRRSRDTAPPLPPPRRDSLRLSKASSEGSSYGISEPSPDYPTGPSPPPRHRVSNYMNIPEEGLTYEGDIAQHDSGTVHYTQHAHDDFTHSLDMYEPAYGAGGGLHIRSQSDSAALSSPHVHHSKSYSEAIASDTSLAYSTPKPRYPSPTSEYVTDTATQEDVFPIQLCESPGAKRKMGSDWVDTLHRQASYKQRSKSLDHPDDDQDYSNQGRVHSLDELSKRLSPEFEPDLDYHTQGSPIPAGLDSLEDLSQYNTTYTDLNMSDSCATMFDEHGNLDMESKMTQTSQQRLHRASYKDKPLDISTEKLPSDLERKQSVGNMSSSSLHSTHSSYGGLSEDETGEFKRVHSVRLERAPGYSASPPVYSTSPAANIPEPQVTSDRYSSASLVSNTSAQSHTRTQSYDSIHSHTDSTQDQRDITLKQTEPEARDSLYKQMYFDVENETGETDIDQMIADENIKHKDEYMSQDSVNVISDADHIEHHHSRGSLDQSMTSMSPHSIPGSESDKMSIDFDKNMSDHDNTNTLHDTDKHLSSTGSYHVKTDIPQTDFDSKLDNYHDPPQRKLHEPPKEHFETLLETDFPCAIGQEQAMDDVKVTNIDDCDTQWFDPTIRSAQKDIDNDKTKDRYHPYSNAAYSPVKSPKSPQVALPFEVLDRLDTPESPIDDGQFDVTSQPNGQDNQHHYRNLDVKTGGNIYPACNEDIYPDSIPGVQCTNIDELDPTDSMHDDSKDLEIQIGAENDIHAKPIHSITSSDSIKQYYDRDLDTPEMVFLARQSSANQRTEIPSDESHTQEPSHEGISPREEKHYLDVTSDSYHTRQDSSLATEFQSDKHDPYSQEDTPDFLTSSIQETSSYKQHTEHDSQSEIKHQPSPSHETHVSTPQDVPVSPAGSADRGLEQGSSPGQSPVYRHPLNTDAYIRVTARVAHAYSDLPLESISQPGSVTASPVKSPSHTALDDEIQGDGTTDDNTHVAGAINENIEDHGKGRYNRITDNEEHKTVRDLINQRNSFGSKTREKLKLFEKHDLDQSNSVQFRKTPSPLETEKSVTTSMECTPPVNRKTWGCDQSPESSKKYAPKVALKPSFKRRSAPPSSSDSDSAVENAVHTPSVDTSDSKLHKTADNSTLFKTTSVAQSNNAVGIPSLNDKDVEINEQKHSPSDKVTPVKPKPSETVEIITRSGKKVERKKSVKELLNQFESKDGSSTAQDEIKFKPSIYQKPRTVLSKSMSPTKGESGFFQETINEEPHDHNKPYSSMPHSSTCEEHVEMRSRANSEPPEPKPKPVNKFRVRSTNDNIPSYDSEAVKPSWCSPKGPNAEMENHGSSAPWTSIV